MADQETNEFVDEVNGYEQEAESFGWKPPEDFQGENHMDAEAFMLRGPGTSRKLQKQLDDVKVSQADTAAEMKAGYDARFARMERTMKAGEEARIQARIDEMAQAKRTAADAGDMDEYDRIVEGEKNLSGAIDSKPVAPAEVIPEMDRRLIKAWTEENTWFMDDPIANAEAIQYYDAFVARGMSTADALKNVRDRMMLKSPYLFPQEQQQRQAAAVDGGGLPGRANGKRRWSDIPQEDRTMVSAEIKNGDWNALATQMKTSPQEAFASVYWEQG